MILARLLAMIRPGFVTEPVLEPRMSPAEVLAAVSRAVGPRPPGQELIGMTLHQVDGRLLWSVGTVNRGASASVEVDDATGAVGPLTHRPLTHHGLR